MTSNEYLLWFVIAAVLTPVIILGGFVMAYFLEQNQDLPPKNTTSGSETAPVAADRTPQRSDRWAQQGSNL